jgi:hypothetical protein
VEEKKKNWEINGTRLKQAGIPATQEARDQEDRSSKPALAKSSMRPYLGKKPSQKRAGGVAQAIGPEFKLQYHKKKRKTD